MIQNKSENIMEVCQWLADEIPVQISGIIPTQRIIWTDVAPNSNPFCENSLKCYWRKKPNLAEEAWENKRQDICSKLNIHIDIGADIRRAKHLFIEGYNAAKESKNDT